MVDLLIYGGGGHAREVAWLAEQIGESCHLLGFIDDALALQDTVLNALPVFSLAKASAQFPGAAVVSGIGSPHARQATMEKAAAAGLRFASLIHPAIRLSRWVEVGQGVVIFAGSTLTVNIRLGNHVHINQGCSVSHDCVLEEYATLAPGVRLAGAVQLGKRVNVGTGAAFINGTLSAPLTVGDDAVIGAGACVIRPVAPGSTVVGVPAKPLVSGTRQAV